MIPLAIFSIAIGCQIATAEHYASVCRDELKIGDSEPSSNDRRCLYACEYAKAFPFAGENYDNYTNIDLEYLSDDCSEKTRNIDDVCQLGSALMECGQRIDREMSEKCKKITETTNIHASTEELGCYLRCIFMERNWVDENNIWKQFAAKISEDKLLDCYQGNNQLDPCNQFVRRYQCIAEAKLALYINMQQSE